MTASFARATFERAATTPENMPPAAGLEVAFAGRSNAGKSSAINALVGQRRLAYTSKTPGRTQEINFFALGEQRFLVDLPGYGYAAVPRALRGRWERVLQHFLRERESLRGLVVIMDVRHPLTPLDTQLLDWFAPTRKPVLVLLTKSDKLTAAQARAVLAKVSQALAAHHPSATAQLFSSTRRIGVEEAKREIAGWLGLEPARGIKTPG